MSRGQLGTLVQHLHRLANAQAMGDWSDGELVRRFVAGNDSVAFAALVRRHGPLVWGVCRRVLRHEQDAEDAFQATFFVLARQASSIRQGEAVGGWLHGVAYRTAMNAKRTAARRRARERRAEPPPPRARRGSPDPAAADLALRELQALLDEEVHALPEKYRTPFVLCCLEGRSKAEAARQLGWKEGTLSSRLDQARKRLRRRFTLRGVSLAAALCAVGIAERAAAAPARLATATVQAALAFATGQAGRVVSESAVALAEGVLRSAGLCKFTGVLAMVVLLGALGAGTGTACYRALAARQRDADGFPRASPTVSQEPVRLSWKFEKGKTFYQEMTTDTKQTMKVMGMDITQNQKQTFYFSWTPQDKDKEGNWVVKQKIEGIKMDIDIGGNQVTFDSTQPNRPANDPLAKFFKGLLGLEFTRTVSPEFKVVKIEGRDHLLQNLIPANQQIEPMLKTILSVSTLQQMADPAFSVVPNKPVKPGESWARESKLDLGPIGCYDTTYQYLFAAKNDKGFDQITMDASIRYSPPARDVANELPFTIKKADLKFSDAKGTVLFDRRKGRVVRSDMSLNLRGKLTIEIGGTTNDVELSQEQMTAMRTTDDNPLQK